MTSFAAHYIIYIIMLAPFNRRRRRRNFICRVK